MTSQIVSVAVLVHVIINIIIQSLFVIRFKANLPPKRFSPMVVD